MIFKDKEDQLFFEVIIMFIIIVVLFFYTSRNELREINLQLKDSSANNLFIFIALFIIFIVLPLGIKLFLLIRKKGNIIEKLNDSLILYLGWGKIIFTAIAVIIGVFVFYFKSDARRVHYSIIITIAIAVILIIIGIIVYKDVYNTKNKIENQDNETIKKLKKEKKSLFDID